jgi:PAS domain-containing protein
MRDQHRTKQELFLEVTALRKQVSDLKEAIVARRRVEDALRQGEEQLRALADSAPIGLCLLHSDGAPALVNRPLAWGLGYESPAELISIGGTLGLFGCPNQLGRIRESVERGAGEVPELVFRRKDAAKLILDAFAAGCAEAGRIALVVGLPSGATPVPLPP